MSKPRLVVREKIYLITRRCTQRQFLLRPDEETNNAFAYCLAEAARRFEIDLVLSTAMSNHHHTIVFDREGRFPEFIEHFHKMLARCLNARWGRTENLWSSQEPSVTRLEDVETLRDKLLYVAINPVKDGLVDRANQWPGFNGFKLLTSGRKLVVRRPRYFFAKDGDMPERVELEFVIPEQLGSREKAILDLKKRVDAYEQDARERRSKTGSRVLGCKRVKEQSWRDCPDSVEPPRRLRPRFAGRGEALKAALISYKEFLAAYQHAREQWLAKMTCLFPSGTYWLQRFVGVPVATAIA